MSPRTALVLSGGCLRGYAHIGVLKALAAAGIWPDLVIGASVGAVVGALYAAGCPPTEIERAGMALVISQLKQWAWSSRGLWTSAGLQSLMRRHLPVDRIEDFPIAFVAVATDLLTGRLALLGTGDAALAVSASAAMPGFFAPVQIAGRAYVDACLASPLPVRAARSMGAQQVIAVNAVLDPGACADRCFVDALLRPSRVMAYTLAAQEAAEADIVIAPRLPASDAVNSRDRQTLIDEGERAALGVIAHRCPACLRLGARHSCASAPTREAA